LIGIISETFEKGIVEEFFELFKTPWEFYHENRCYDVVIATRDYFFNIKTKLLFIYGSNKTQYDVENNIVIGSNKKGATLEYEDLQLPIYNKVSTFADSSSSMLRIKGTKGTVSIDAGVKINGKNKKIIRIGYDLFQEIYFLLSSGQPAEYAHIPSLEIHISILKKLILTSGIPLVEIPPIPSGYDFITCLTHDVDFAGIKNHRFDRTMFGFLYRALLKSFIDVLMGRASWGKLLNNWRAALLLPAVYANIVEDFWIQFARYMEIEKGLPSTFFFIPFKKMAGKKLSGPAPKLRESKYDISDIKSYVRYLISQGCEIGLHGIDAWLDSENGRREFDKIHQETGNLDIGVRMHWLYFQGQSPMHLEKAGFLYDSTYGYNNTVGFKGGTTQVFRPLGVERLLELPLQIQDTALFYSGRMGLEEDSAFELCRTIVSINLMYGGVLVINWHHRSIAPERLWGEFYERLIHHLREYRVWFGTAGEVVRWFEKRRKAQFNEVKLEESGLKIKICGQEGFSRPDLILRLHKPKLTFNEKGKETVNDFIDVPIRDGDETEISF